MAKWTAGLTVVSAGGALAYAYAFDEGAWRTLRVLRSLVPMGVDYWRLWYRTRSVSDDARRQEFDAYHEKWRDEPLRVCLDLRGFYVKVGQLCAGFPGDGLPLPYKESLAVLQEDVPPQPFTRMKAIAEAEIGCKLEEVFAEFDQTPMGAASIGQVHRARLLDGTEVVVKLQYPECEGHFRLDFSTIISIFRLVNEVMVPVLNAVEEGFTAEFDYRLEAANLRRMVDVVLPLCEKARLAVSFPRPYDSDHPNLPTELRQRGQSLATKRLLVMDHCPGSSLSKIGKRVLTDFAATRGQSAAEYEREMKDCMLQDPEFLKDLLRQASPTANQLRLYRGWVSFRAAAFNVCAFLYNCTAGLIRPHLTYATARLPPNGPRLMEAIYAAHGFQIFEAGAFNADPHAGNVLLDEHNETVHLVDYGQLVEISEKDRLAFAYLLIALDESDADAAHETFQTWGCESTWKGKRDPDGRYKDPPMKPPPVWVALASAHMNFGGAAGMAYGLKAFEFETVAQLLGPELDDMVTNEKLPSIMMMLMRCCMCLGGTGDACGLFAVSPGKMLLPSAKAYLQKRGLPLRNPDAAPKRKNALTN